MPSRAGLILLTSAVLAGTLGAAAWWVGASRREVLTDDARIERPADEARPRDILWQPPTPVDPALVPPGAVGGAFAPGGHRFAFAAPGPAGDLDLFEAIESPQGWSARRLAFTSSIDQDTTPTYSPDGQWLWFASDRAGGAGGFDLWRAPAVGDGWGPAARVDTIPDLQTTGDELSPALAPDGSMLALARRAEADAPADLALFALEDGAPARPLQHDLNSEAQDCAPAFSPAGDFLYFASDRPGGAGALDLYRARIVAGATGPPESLGEEVNSDGDETDPALGLAGFRLRFRDGNDYRETTAREVYRTVRSRWPSFGLGRELLRVLPWLLAALALVLLFAGLHRLASRELWRKRWGTLGLMARCLLASAAIHAVLALLFTVWRINTALPGLQADEGTRVILTTNAAASAVTAQVRAPTLDSREAPAVDTPSVQPAPAPSPAPDRIAAAATSAPATLPSPTEVSPDPEQPRPTTLAVETAPPRADSPNLPVEAMQQSGETESRSTQVAAETPRIRPDSPVAAATRLAPAETSTTAGPAASLPEAPRPHEAELALALQTRAIDQPPSQPPTRLPTSAPDAVAEQSSRDARPDPAPTASTSIAGAAPPTTTSTTIDPAPNLSDSLSASLAGALAPPREVEPEQSRAQPAEPARLGPAPGPTALAAPALPTGPGAEPSPAHESDAESSRLALGAQAAPLRPDAPRAEGPRVPLPRSAAQTPTPAPPLPEIDETAPPRALSLPRLDLAAAPTTLPVARLISGVVLDAKTDQPIPTARVRLDGDGDTIRAAKVDDAGRFALAPAQLPTFAALTASAEGYIPAAVNVAAAEIGDGIRVEFRLQPADNLDIALDAEPRVHHLGDDRFTGRINSQFQVSSQGRTYQAVIELDRSQLTPPVVVAELTLFVRGAQNPNRIIVNGVVITEPLADSPEDGSFGEFVARFPLRLLREGENVIEIQSMNRPGTDLDDFEFVNPRLLLKTKAPRRSNRL